ncbi:uncharacterized protein LOC101859790 [Aplysia californica]|uniref:Uncharacterized protein LOC101859790 n=1 Tax=Aplysia californica TaxID=6500 RepID=A0ABM1A1Q2_APLCA|nr:uncharacterized protein LOC101859790 [Aplysia californica]
MYANPDEDFEIQGKTWPCQLTPTMSCLCALTVRSHRDVIRASICHSLMVPENFHDVSKPERLQMLWANTRLTFKIPNHGLRNGTEVFHDPDLNQALISFPGGERIEMERRGISLNVVLNLPPGHARSASAGGVCGNMAKNFTHHQLTNPDGSQTTCQKYTGQKDCLNTNFNSAWKQPKGKSLFTNPPAYAKPYTPKSLCACSDDASKATKAINCGADGNQKPKMKDCVGGCKDITNGLPPGLFGGTWKRAVPGLFGGTPGQISVDFDVNEFVDKSPNSSQSAPQATAEERHNATHLCTDVLGKSVLLDHCGPETRRIMDSIMEDCVTDVLTSGDHEFAKTALAALNNLCRDKIRRNPKNYKPNKDGVLEILPEVSTEICSQTCIEHGHCEKGKCVCDPGYRGIHCSKPEFLPTGPVFLWPGSGASPHSTTGMINIDHTDTRLSATCDVAMHSCNPVRLVLADRVHSAKCSVRIEGKDVSVTKSAKIGFSQEVDCTIPEFYVGKTLQGSPSINITLTVTIDGGRSQHTIYYFVYDSRCLTFAPNGQKTIAPDVCVIDSTCFPDGARNAHVVDRACVVTESQTQWRESINVPLRPEDVTLNLEAPFTRSRLACHVGQSTVDQHVLWYLNGIQIRDVTLQPGQSKAEFDMTSVKSDRAVIIQCKSPDPYTPHILRVSKEFTYA